MSRIGRAPIAVPAAVKIITEGQRIQVEGPKGKLAWSLPETINAKLDGETLRITRQTEERSVKALHGLSRALVANMVLGVTNGFTRELEIVGVGFKAALQGKQLTLNVGYSHPVVIPIPEGITLEVPKPTIVIIKGVDKQQVGQFAANIRGVYPPEPYKGKGIRYQGEVVRKKAGKAATGSGAKSGGGG
jgi:large subunit ribosomal protein L6